MVAKESGCAAASAGQATVSSAAQPLSFATTRTYTGCDVEGGVARSCVVVQFDVHLGPWEKPGFGLYYGWRELGWATFDAPGNIDRANMQTPVSTFNAATGRCCDFKPWFLSPTLYEGTHLFIAEQPEDVFFLPASQWDELVATLDAPWTMAVLYGPAGAALPSLGQPIPAGWASRSFSMFVTPEPSTATLALTGVLALVGVAATRRRRARG